MLLQICKNLVQKQHIGHEQQDENFVHITLAKAKLECYYFLLNIVVHLFITNMLQG